MVKFRFLIKTFRQILKNDEKSEKNQNDFSSSLHSNDSTDDDEEEDSFSNTH